MNIQELKQEILDKELNDDLIIFVCQENSFLANSYINEICEFKNLEKNYVGSLKETIESTLSLVFDYSNDMNIIKVETFDEFADDYDSFQNCVVICKKIDSKLKEAVSDYVVEVPKLTDWQVKAYMQTVCPGLTEKASDWLYLACCKDIYKIDNELQKLSLVEPEKQVEALREIFADPTTDLFEKESVFKLVDALVDGNKKTAYNFIKHADYYSVPYVSSEGKKERDLDPVGLTTLTLTKLKNILLLNYNSGIKPEDIGVSSGAAYYIRQKNIPLNKLQKMIDFLSGIDGRLKTNPSSLDFIGCRKNALLEYIITGVLACHEG